MISKYSHKQLIPHNNIRIVRKIFDGRTETHTHDYFEIEYIFSGSGVYIIDGISYNIEPNMLFYMTPANIHTVISEKIDIVSVLIKDCSIFHNISEQHQAIKLNKNDAMLYESLCYELLNNEKNINYSQQLIQTIISKINILSDIKKTIKTPPVKKALIYILNNFKNNINLTDVANHVNLSPAYFSFIFKKENNINFKQYIDSLRFEYAKKLITNSDSSILEICNESGFDNYENFVRRFKKIYNTTPSQYRQEKTIPKP